MTDFGSILDVRVVNNGSFLAVDAPLASTTLVLDDAGDFSEDGGTLNLTSTDVDGTITTLTYNYTSIDFSTETLTLTSSLSVAGVAGDPVSALPNTVSKQAVIMLSGSQDAITAVVPHNLMTLLPEGIRDEGSQESVSVELVGTTWTLTNILNKDPEIQSAIQSQNYADSDSGWLMDTEHTQFDNAFVSGTVGADTGTFNSLTIGDQDLVNDILPSKADGLIAFCQLSGAGSNSVSINTASGETAISRSSLGVVQAGYFYRMSFFLVGNGTLIVNGDVYDARVWYTTDGTTPIVASGTSKIMPGSRMRMTANANNRDVYAYSAWYFAPTVPIANLRIAVAVQQITGTGSFVLKNTDANSSHWFAAEGVALQTAVGGSMSQVNVATGGTNEGSDKATYTKTYWATDSASYDGSGSKRAGDTTTTDMYQGYYSSTHGDTRSAAAFDWSTIQKDLAGSTIQSCKLTYRVKHAYYNAGLNVRVSWHNSSSPPSTQSQPGTLLASKNGCVEGGTYTVDLTPAFGNNLRDGNYKGVVFYGPSNSLSYYGYMYGGNSSSSRPRITITYTK